MGNYFTLDITEKKKKIIFISFIYQLSELTFLM